MPPDGEDPFVFSRYSGPSPYLAPECRRVMLSAAEEAGLSPLAPPRSSTWRLSARATPGRSAPPVPAPAANYRPPGRSEVHGAAAVRLPLITSSTSSDQPTGSPIMPLPPPGLAPASITPSASQQQSLGSQQAKPAFTRAGTRSAKENLRASGLNASPPTPVEQRVQCHLAPATVCGSRLTAAHGKTRAAHIPADRRGKCDFDVPRSGCADLADLAPGLRPRGPAPAKARPRRERLGPGPRLCGGTDS